MKNSADKLPVIENICVHSDFHGRSIAGLLMRRICRLLKDEKRYGILNEAIQGTPLFRRFKFYKYDELDDTEKKAVPDMDGLYLLRDYEAEIPELKSSDT